ncbi:uncharacterized protein Bfra_007161 [Botrytis fragariae]|uniref:Uncharacterized protein n=1 Tax=Botrytis fragariae TaxID=1964551 RepID=A0A8H6AIK4_9HELO|nr:uncharacterized protein Bfra_007161 [Botrytis fragariae]KAF5867966.1 hypothetical protein Bfra_007161 [Botrytis fragariae]
MSPPISIPPSRSTQVDKQHPRPRLENDSRRDSHDSDEGKPAPLPLLYPKPPLPPVFPLEGQDKDRVTECILKERALEMREKEDIQEIEESNGWRFTSDTAGKMYLKIQDKDTSTFIKCNNFARDCKKAIRSNPRVDSRLDSKRKGALAPGLSNLLTPERKAQHLERLDTLLTSKNRYAQYWTIDDLPSEWLKIDNEVLCSKEDQVVLIKNVEKKKRALEKSKPGGKVEDGKHKERHRLSINAVKRTSDDKQREGRQEPICKFEVEGVIVTEMRRSNRERLYGRAHEGRRVLEDELEKERMTSKNRPRIHDPKVDGKTKNIQQAPINGIGRERIVIENSRGDTRTEIDERSKEGRRVSGDEVAKTKTAVAENSRHNGRKEVDGKSKLGRQVLGDEIGKKKMVPGDRSRIGNPEVDGRLKNKHRAPINGTEKEQILVEKPGAGSKVEDDGNFKEDNVLPNKRHGSAVINEVGDKKTVAIERSRNGTAETNKGLKDDSVLPKKRHGSATMDEAENKRAMAVDKSRNGKVETDGRSKDTSLPPKKRHGSQ